MSKTITLTYEGKEYTLEYTRKSVERMEATGFNVEELASKPLSTLPLLWKGSFLAHHKNIKAWLQDKMFEQMPRKEELFDRLADMYMETVESLFEEPENDEGNLEWEVNW